MKDGYYWVKHEGEWTIARFETDHFFIIFCDCFYYEEDFDEIGDYIETPDKYKE